MKSNPLSLLLAMFALALLASACATPPPSNVPFATPTAAGLAIGSTFVGSDGGTMLYVPAGDFTMGSTDQQVADYTQQEEQANTDPRTIAVVQKYLGEKPQHLVYLDAFWMDKFNVTNELYKKCLDAGKCSAPVPLSSNYKNTYFGDSQFDNYPVIWVSWDDAKSYCAWAGERLPTEAEWEKAARSDDVRLYPWGNTYDDNMRSQNGPSAVDSRPADVSPYGVMDLVGNVKQWVNDLFSDTHYARSARRNPPGPQPFLGLFGGEMSIRGGSYHWPEAREQRAARRFHD